MKTAVFSAHRFEETHLKDANHSAHDLIFIKEHLDENTAKLADGCEAVCLFVSDCASAAVLKILKQCGIKYIALRSAGYNHVDIAKAHELGIAVARVPAYSPYAVAEHAICLMLALNRKLKTTHKRITQNNFSLDGLTGFDMNGKTAGIIGTGKIGSVVANILHGFGCSILAIDEQPDSWLWSKYGVKYTDLETLLEKSDIISLHVPLTPATKNMINASTIQQMKNGVMLINTARGSLINTTDVIAGLKSGKIGYFGMDVYEHEENLFFEDHSQEVLQDDVFARLLTFDNVMITGHQAFLTGTALTNIAKTTIFNLDCFAQKLPSGNEIPALAKPGHVH